MTISTRKLAALLRSILGDEDRREAMRHVACAMRSVRGFGTTTPVARKLIEEPTVATLLAQENALGVISQALSSGELERAYRATTQLKRKFQCKEIPAVTQLFTPRWVVELLLQNSLDKLRGQRCVTNIRVLDAACGTMNFGLVALQMLQAMYREQ